MCKICAMFERVEMFKALDMFEMTIEFEVRCVR